jgi:hypothetical protein
MHGMVYAEDVHILWSVEGDMQKYTVRKVQLMCTHS